MMSEAPPIPLPLGLCSSEIDTEWLAPLLECLPDLICLKDEAGRWLLANRPLLRLAGLEEVAWQGMTSADLAHMAQRGDELLLALADSDRTALDSGRPVTFEQTVGLPGGETRMFQVTKLPLHHADGRPKGLVEVGRDITDRRQAAARIQHLARHDSLTGLPNRATFVDRLAVAVANAKRSDALLAVMVLDLDKLKDINDTLGHGVGDQLLRAIGNRLRTCVRDTDTVARLSGDEFALVLSGLQDAHGASTVAENILRAMAEPFGLGEHEVSASLSIGVTLFPVDSTSEEELLKNADLALARAKREGRNRYQFYISQMDQEVRARKAIERDLRYAMGFGQLTLFYQPFVDLRTGRISGCEALIRWHHPERGFVSPAQFIPIAERTDLIVPLGRWVMQHACSQLAAWQDAGLPPLQMAINLSPMQFKHSDIAETVGQTLDETGVDPHLLQLEITEGIAMHNVEATIRTLKQLRGLGCKVSIDDFGTGYSSLSYLKSFPVDKLKIDRSFVPEGAHQRDNEAIIRAIINLGHGIGARVNVEGVETAEQLSFMHSHGVDEVQGFYFSKPLPGPEFFQLASGGPLWTPTP